MPQRGVKASIGTQTEYIKDEYDNQDYNNPNRNIYLLSLVCEHVVAIYLWEFLHYHSSTLSII